MTELERQLMEALVGLAGQVEDLSERIETRMQALTGSMNSLTRLVNQHATQAERLETRVKVLGTFYDDLVKQLRRL